MRKISIILLLLLSFNFVKSQSLTGINVGMNFSSLSGDSSQLPIQTVRTGLNIGLTWDIKTVYKTYIQVGIFYSQQGTYNKIEYFDYGNKYTYLVYQNLDYIKIPFLWKQKWGDWYTTLGLYGAYVPNPKKGWKEWIEYSTYTDTTTGIDKTFTKQNIVTFDVGASFSIGFQYEITKSFDFFMNFGLTRGFLALNPKDVRVENKMYNMNFSITTGIILLPNKTNTNRRRR